MAYYDPNESLWTPEEAYQYLSTHGIMTDATFSNLNDDSYTEKRMKPVYDYLEQHGMKVNNGGFFDESYGFGAVYFMYDEERYSLEKATDEVNQILKIWKKYNPE
ncbi:hypothetical protein ACFQ22_01440 [Lentilactobacillus raoultii]|uniref:SLH domain-containing protein n=1 Tax=Lentilactobacillus raoultii TaxID=1987503 RepID=A0ABW3PJA1_9LACO|nr:hypothetical protein [Lentilactobacillus raoultii]